MPDLIIPADVEQAVIDELDDLVIGTKIPEPRPNYFIRVISVGGVPETLVSDAFTVTVEVYGSQESATATLAARVLARLSLAALQGKLGNVACYRMGVMALPQNYPNPSVPSHYRYVMTLVPVLRRHVAQL